MNVEKYAAAEAAPGASDRMAQTWWTALIIGWIRARSWKRRSCGVKQVEDVKEGEEKSCRRGVSRSTLGRSEVMVEAGRGWEG